MRIANILLVALVLAACSSTAGPTTTTGGIDPTSTTLAPTTTTTTEPTTTTTVATTTSAAPWTSITVEVPDGWTVHDGETTSIAAPASWFDGREVLEDPEAIAGGLDELGLDTLQQFMDSLGPSTLDVIDIMLLDATTLEDGFVTNANVIVAPVGPITDLVTIESAIEVQIESFGGTLDDSAIEEINGIESLVVDYTLSTTQGEINARQYHQILGEDLYTTTFTGVESEPDLWRRMMATLVPHT